MPEDNTLRGSAVVPGDVVRLVSPATAPSKEWLAESVSILESWGLAAALRDG